MANITLKRTMEGSIVDMDGGGEGVIGRIYQSQVRLSATVGRSWTRRPAALKSL